MAEMEDLGKKAKYLELRVLNSGQNNGANAKYVNNTDKYILASQASGKDCPVTSLTKIYRQTNVSESCNLAIDTLDTNPSIEQNNLKTKRDKRRKKPVEKEIKAGEIPGNIGDRTVEELEDFIKVSFKLVKTPSSVKNLKELIILNYST